MSRSNTRERVGLAGLYEGTPSPCFYPDLLMRVRVSDKVDPKFLEQALLSKKGRRYFRKVARGTSGSMVKIDRALLEGFPIDLPPKAEQRKIAAILSSIDETIEKSRAVIERLQIVKSEMIRDLLARGLPGALQLKQTELGPLPDNWNLVPLSNVVSKGPENGLSPKARNMPPGTPTFSIGAVRDGRVNIQENLKYVDLSPTQARAYEVQSGDVLIVRGNASPKLLGACGIVDSHPDGCIYPDILMRIRCGSDVDPYYIVEAWNSDFVHDQLLLRAKTTNGTYKINNQDVRSVQVPIPPLDQQRQISELARSLAENILRNGRCVAALHHLKSALSTALLSGEIRVTPDPEPEPTASAI